MPPVTSSESQDHQQAQASILKERRFKLSRACDRCRRRRIKCDEGHPCQACLSANSACTFEEPGKRTHPHKSKRTATLEDRMHHLETLIQAIPPAVFAAGGIVPPVNTSTKASTDPSTTSPITPFMYPSQAFPLGVPPPSLHVFPLINPSTHFSPDPKANNERQQSPIAAFNSLFPNAFPSSTVAHVTTPDQLADETSRMSLAASYLYFDDEGYTRWQGETSGLPLLDLLVERHTPANNREKVESPANIDTSSPGQNGASNSTNTDWFPNRTLRRTDINPQILWRLITSYIVPELMDSLVQCYLSTSYYILPFLHVPTFLADYGNPQKWGEPGFAAFIVSICCLASRHMDDPRVRPNANDSISAGTHWFELLGRLRTLPIADRPTLYTIQANLIAAVYAVGLGRLSKAASLLSEAITMCIDSGMHRSADTYDVFDPIEDEVRKRTFWCVYIWDKQLAAHFGRPPMIRLRDCDVGEPSPVDDEYISHDGIGTPPTGTESRMTAFICSLRILVILESVVDVPPARTWGDSSPFLMRAASVLSGTRRYKELREEEALLDEVHHSIPPFWSHTPDTLASEDTIRVTQAERLHAAEHFVRLLIYRHRFSELVAERMDNGEEEQLDAEKEATIAAHNSALQIITTHLQIAKKGLMTYYGVHVIHQLTQAGRTLVAILLNCKSEALQHLISPALDALRSCVGLLRRFSGRYVCGLRSGDLMEEFCRLTQIPLETSRSDGAPSSSTRPAWIRPIRKKAHSVARSSHSDVSQHSSPEAFSPADFLADPPKSAFQNGTTMMSPKMAGPSSPAFSGANGVTSSGVTNGNGQASSPFADTSSGMNLDPQMFMNPSDVMALFNDGSVDVNSMFGSDFIQSQPSPPSASPNDQSTNGFGTPGMFKMNGIVSSP
ncbi:hypothetical protein CCMSSC00406_0007161 [Pleurotus cornucopiae]|uniref:Uncharacterized protein n=1 Tax=Pleurotus cornucopiae TaxID=5321 RepID=A0ACB7IQX0_PLECO|nr:hypothetical protein CCMSSC00406_0007161 [Pleurotus cornucopiae]